MNSSRSFDRWGLAGAPRLAGVFCRSACGAACAGVCAMVVGAAAAAPLSAVLLPAAVSAAVATRVAGAAPAAAPIMAGDLIVKFRDASEPGAQLAAVLSGQRSVPSVAPIAARLTAELNVPLVLVQVTSGREALLALDRAALAQALVSRAGRETAVQRASVAGAGAGARPGLPGAELVLRLELKRGVPPPAAPALAQRFAAGGLTAPRIVREGGDALNLHYDIDALTLALIGKLQQRAEVEYAQANRLLRPAAPPASR